MEFLRQEYWSGLPFYTPGDLPTQESNPHLLHLASPAFLGGFFTAVPLGEPLKGFQQLVMRG